MGSSTSLDRYTQSSPKITTNAVWENSADSEGGKAGAISVETRIEVPPREGRTHPPASDYLDDLIKLHERKRIQRLNDGTRKALSEQQNRDIRIRKRRPSSPPVPTRNVVFAKQSPQHLTEARIQMLTKRVDELESSQDATNNRMKAITVEVKSLETMLDSAIVRIHTLRKELEDAKSGTEIVKYRQEGDTSGSKFQPEYTDGNRKRRRSDDGDEK